MPTPSVGEDGTRERVSVNPKDTRGPRTRSFHTKTVMFHKKETPANRAGQQQMLRCVPRGPAAGLGGWWALLGASVLGRGEGPT